MSVPALNVMLTLPSPDDARALIVSIPWIVPSESSSGRTIRLSVSTGEDDG